MLMVMRLLMVVQNVTAVTAVRRARCVTRRQVSVCVTTASLDRAVTAVLLASTGSLSVDVRSSISLSVSLVLSPLPSNRHRRSNDDCLEGKRENYEVCSVQYCVQQLYTVQCTHTWMDLTVLWIGFCITGPISLCLDSFLCMCAFCVSLYIACVVLYHGEVYLVWLKTAP